ncbi:MAG: hypothetical protein ABJC13_03015 [Acidobacteriota bacterium]
MNPSPQSRPHRSVAALLLLAFLALPAGAAPRDCSFFSSPWSLLSALWEELGAVVDPSDRPAPGIVVGNNGAVAHPNGQPAAGPGSQDIGIEADPNGQPNH